MNTQTLEQVKQQLKQNELKLEELLSVRLSLIITQRSFELFFNLNILFKNRKREIYSFN
jgi:hypothetical protein